MSGAEADRRYAESIPLAEIGAEVVYAAKVDSQLLGDEAEVGHRRRRAATRAAGPSSRMQQRDDFKDTHQHKDAALAQTIVIAGVPIGSPALPADAPSWDDGANPPPPTATPT